MEQQSILSGDLSAIALPDVLSFLSVIKKTGTLVITRGSVSKTIYWNAGQIVFASSTEFRDSLGPFLVESGRITPEENLNASKLVTPSVRLGKVLVQLGLLTPNELWKAVREQVLEIVYSIFSWNRGVFAFYDGEPLSSERILVNQQTATIVMEGIRRFDEWNRIKEKIPDETMILKVNRSRRERVKGRLQPEDRKLLDLLDANRTVEAIIPLAGLGKMATFKRLYSLLTTGVIEPVDRGSRQEEIEDKAELSEALSTYNYIFHLLHRVVAAKNSDKAVSLFGAGLEEQAKESPDLLRGLSFNEEGQLTENLLLANISELPGADRRRVLSVGLSALLSRLVELAGRHLTDQEREKFHQLITKVSLQR